jgi:hypothetical protein
MEERVVQVVHQAVEQVEKMVDSTDLDFDFFLPPLKYFRLGQACQTRFTGLRTV